MSSTLVSLKYKSSSEIINYKIPVIEEWEYWAKLLIENMFNPHCNNYFYKMRERYLDMVNGIRQHIYKTLASIHTALHWRLGPLLFERFWFSSLPRLKLGRTVPLLMRR